MMDANAEHTNVEACRAKLIAWSNQAESNGPALRDAAVAAVVEWKWSRWWLWNPAPFWFERGEVPRGRPFAQPPAQPEYHHFQTGFDTQGRVRIERQYLYFVANGERWYDEKFFEYSDGRVSWAKLKVVPRPEYDGGGAVWLKDGRVMLLGNCAGSKYENRTWFERYDWSTPGLLRVASDLAHSDGVEEVSFDAADKPIEVRTVYPDRSPWIKWRRRRKGVSLTSLGRKVVEALKAEIVQVVGRWASPGPAYCLAISYIDEGDNLFLPAIGVGLESERAKWMSERDHDAGWMIWNPAEFANFANDELNIDLPEMREEVRMLNQMIMEEQAGDKGVKMIRKMAAELGKLDWSEITNVTDDFAVFSVGMEMSELEEDLKACLGKRRLTALKRANLIL